MNNPRRQQGVVLLIALIILVAMTLAGIGMMRSVDTGSVIAGNLAFQQATMHANDAGTNRGFGTLVSVANTGNKYDKTILNNSDGDLCSNAPGATAAGCDVPGATINLPGYRPTPMHACEVTHTCLVEADYTWWKDPSSWANAPTIAVADPNTPGHDIATVSYLIHRMCQSAGPTDLSGGQVCQIYEKKGTGCGHSFPPPPCKSKSVFYRVTARSVGERNTVTYAQTLVLIAK